MNKTPKIDRKAALIEALTEFQASILVSGAYEPQHIALLADTFLKTFLWEKES